MKSKTINFQNELNNWISIYGEKDFGQVTLSITGLESETELILTYEEAENLFEVLKFINF